MAAVKNEYGLTDKQEAFAQGMVSGLNQCEAYKRAYPSQKASSKTIDRNATKLKKDTKIIARIKQLKRENENIAIWTRQDALEMLLRTANDAETAVREPIMNDENKLVGYRYNAGASNVIVKAVEAAAKMCGYNEPEAVTGKIEIVIDSGADDYSE